MGLATDVLCRRFLRMSLRRNGPTRRSHWNRAPAGPPQRGRVDTKTKHGRERRECSATVHTLRSQRLGLGRGGVGWSLGMAHVHRTNRAPPPPTPFYSGVPSALTSKSAAYFPARQLLGDPRGNKNPFHGSKGRNTK